MWIARAAGIIAIVASLMMRGRRSARRGPGLADAERPEEGTRVSTRRYFITKILQALPSPSSSSSRSTSSCSGGSVDPAQLISRGRGNMTPAACRLETHLVSTCRSRSSSPLRQGDAPGAPRLPSQPAVSTGSALAIWPTVLLIGTSTIASILIGVWIGIKQGWRWGSKFDQSSSGVTLFLYSMPEFWFGLLMIMLFSSTLGSSLRAA